MRLLTLLFLLLAINVKAQSNLKFDTSLLDSEKNWVALPMGKDSSFVFGFVYMDNMAGLTFHLDGSFKFDKGNKVILKKQPQINVLKQRITPTALKVAIIPSYYYTDLQITAEPEWLKFYHAEDQNIDRLFKLGSTHNAWNQSEKALTYLSKVKAINPDYRNLNFELAFAYNASKQFDKAAQLIEEALKKNPNDCLLYKELLYAQINMKEIDKTITNAQIALSICTDKNMRSELLRNILYHYFSTKNKEQFTIWYKKAKEEMANNQKALQVLEKWNSELNP